MKSKIILVAALLLTGIDKPILAQGKTGAPPNPNLHEVSVKIKQQMRQIQKDRKSGKLTPAQAKAALGNLKTVRRLELEYFHQNGAKEISVQQKDQLDTMLGQNNPI